MKDKLTYVIAWLAYWFGVDCLFYILNRKCKRVLTFHNVFPDELTIADGGGGMSISESTLKSIVREIGKRYRFSTDFDDTETATLTFDDGFLNQYEVAARVLADMGIPAVLFVAGDNIDRTQTMGAPAVDLLTLWLAHVPQKVLVDFAESLSHGNGTSVDSHVSRMRFWIDVLRPLYVDDSRARGRSVVAKCDQAYPFSALLAALPSEYVRLRLCGVSSAQLNDLRGRGWKIGWHAKSHYPLSAIPCSEKHQEFQAPDDIKSMPMSYPYGELRSVDDDDVRICRESGFPMAFSNLPECNRLMGPFFRMRFSVPSDEIMLHFHLSGFRHFLKFRRLLPVGTGERGYA